MRCLLKRGKIAEDELKCMPHHQGLGILSGKNSGIAPVSDYGVEPCCVPGFSVDNQRIVPQYSV